eukprot:5517714-Prymnesium_polylepis.1
MQRPVPRPTRHSLAVCARAFNRPGRAFAGIFPRPVAVKGKIEVRPMMYIALTYDHRLIDGREAVTFLKRVKELVQDPARFLLEV